MHRSKRAAGLGEAAEVHRDDAEAARGGGLAHAVGDRARERERLLEDGLGLRVARGPPEQVPQRAAHAGPRQRIREPVGQGEGLVERGPFGVPAPDELQPLGPAQEDVHAGRVREETGDGECALRQADGRLVEVGPFEVRERGVEIAQRRRPARRP